MMVKILERCNVSPSPPCVSPGGAVSSILVPLTYFDIPWLLFPPSQPLFFYDYPHSTLDFLSSVLPLLKSSLALALRTFFPFAGALLNTTPPSLASSHFGTISFVVAESTLPAQDFQDLALSTDFPPRHADRFQALVPSLLPPGDKDAVPLMAVQITAFSGFGFSVGIAYHHVAADERTFNNFLKSWTSFCSTSFPGNPRLLVEGPWMDRSVIRERPDLEERFLNEWNKRKSCSSPPTLTALDVVVRSTFVVGPSDITLIKNQILAHCTLNNLPVPLHLSPYVLVCSFVWVNWVKAHLTRSDQLVPTRSNPIYFGFIAGGITRLDYQVSNTYFGNCVGFGRGEAICEEVMGEDGVVVAASAIAHAIKKLDKSMLEGAQGWIRDWEVFTSSSSSHNNNNLNLMVSGSPKVEFYQTDFGWGKPKKIEQVSIDKTKGISLHHTRDAPGGMQIGLSLPTPIMYSFTSLFLQALKDLLPSTN